MTPEEVVRHYYTLVDAKNFTDLVQLFSESSIYHRPGYEPLIGRSALADFYNHGRVITDGRHTISELLSDGRKVATVGEFDGTIASGDDVHVRFADFFTLDLAGLICARDTFFFSPVI
jgi:steroid Delta-isomerase